MEILKNPHDSTPFLKPEEDNEDGEWCRWEDVEQLKIQFNKLQKKYKDIKIKNNRMLGVYKNGEKNFYCEIKKILV